MKNPKSFSLLIIPAGIVVIALSIILVLNLERIVKSAGLWLFGIDPKSTGALFYLAAFFIPVLSGFLMCLAVVLIFRREYREYEENLRIASESTDDLCSSFQQNLDSINDSIASLRASTRQMKTETKRLSDLERRIGGKKNKPADGYSRPAVAFENYQFWRISSEYDEAETFPAEPFLLPQFRHKE
jgi:hypothetical protein